MLFRSAFDEVHAKVAGTVLPAALRADASSVADGHRRGVAADRHARDDVAVAGGAGAAWRRGGAAATATARTDAGDQRRRKQQASPAGPGGKGHGHSNRITSRYEHYVTRWPGILVSHNPA